MSFRDFCDKYAKQIKSMSPKYDIFYKVSKDDPIKFEDSANVLLAGAAIADTHLPNREAAEANLGNFFEDLSNSPGHTPPSARSDPFAVFSPPDPAPKDPAFPPQ